MKKVLFSIVALMISVCVINAQENEEENDILKSKKGTPILPQSGDYAIGIDAAPMINFAGQVLNSVNAGGAATSPGFNQLTEPTSGLQSIYLKKFLSDKEALRVKVMINMRTDTRKDYVQDDKKWDDLVGSGDQADYDDAEMDLTEKYVDRNNDIGVLVGKEMRRGYGRLQGFYGAEVGLMYTCAVSTYKYANEYMEDTEDPALDTDPSSTDWGTGNLPADDAVVINKRTLKETQRDLTLMVNGFVGVEYFVLPKISIGGEMYLGLAYTGQGKAKNTYEGWDTDDEAVVEVSGKGYTNPNTFTLQNFTGGNLFLVFHF